MNHSRFVQTTFWKCIGFLLALPLMGAAQTYTITDLGPGRLRERRTRDQRKRPGYGVRRNTARRQFTFSLQRR